MICLYTIKGYQSACYQGEFIKVQGEFIKENLSKRIYQNPRRIYQRGFIKENLSKKNYHRELIKENLGKPRYKKDGKKRWHCPLSATPPLNRQKGDICCLKKERKSRQMRFRDKTAYVSGLGYLWDPLLSWIANPISHILSHSAYKYAHKWHFVVNL